MSSRRLAVRRFVLLVAIAAVARSAAAQAAPVAPEGSIGIRLLEAPRELAEDPRAQLYVIDHVDQGETIRRRIEISSGLARVERLQLYAAGAFVANGRFSFLEARTQNELSSWISVDPPSVQVPANGTATGVVTIAVPRTAADGERYAVVWAETPPSAVPGEDVVTVNRVGIRVYLSVGRGDTPATDFQIRSLTAARDPTGHPVVTATVMNTGGRAIDLSGELRLSEGPGALSAGAFPVELGTTVAIGRRAAVRVVLPRAIPDGPWTADLRLVTGLVERHAEARIVLLRTADARSAPVPATSAGSLDRPLPSIVAFVVVLAFALSLLLARRRRRAKDDA